MMPNPDEPAIGGEAAGCPCGDAKHIASIWRSGIGDAVSAVDLLEDRWRGSRRRKEREMADELDRVLTAVFDGRMRHAPQDYPAAVEAGKQIISAVRAELLKGEDDERG